ncbi:unnamed protein product [Spodoptera exigua]|nr:unnamed protein product [Spodoptera exigua]
MSRAMHYFNLTGLYGIVCAHAACCTAHIILCLCLRGRFDTALDNKRTTRHKRDLRELALWVCFGYFSLICCSQVVNGSHSIIQYDTSRNRNRDVVLETYVSARKGQLNRGDTTDNRRETTTELCFTV